MKAKSRIRSALRGRLRPRAAKLPARVPIGGRLVSCVVGRSVVRSDARVTAATCRFVVIKSAFAPWPKCADFDDDGE